MSEIIDVLTRQYGAIEAKDSKPNYATRKFELPNRESNIAVSPSRDLWTDNLSGKGGRGAINLIMHMEGFNQKQFANAKKILEQATGVQYTANSFVSKPKPIQATQKAVIVPEIPAADRWQQVRQYLIEKRNLPEPLVDLAHKSGKVYADQRGNAVFVRENDTGYFKRSAVSTFKQTIGQSGEPFMIKGNDGKLFVTEAPIDALTIKALNPFSSVIATGGHSTPLANLGKYIATAAVIHLAFDNDDAGNKFIGMIKKEFPAAKFGENYLAPAGFKDWNKYLQESPDATQKINRIHEWAKSDHSFGSPALPAKQANIEKSLDVKIENKVKPFGFGG